ncbi:MAG: hypothetical protein GSR85_00780 [Desulfurococcales archaeon]|nr:hypothetical protein [Desulfurococcales archaeon]
MPTVHLSLPDQVYSQLKEKAGELGIQITDLIKFYIRLGLEKGFARQERQVSEESLVVLSKKVDRLEKEFRVRTTIVEGKYRQVEETLNYILERLEMIEDLLGEVKYRRVIGETGVYEEA